MTAESQTLWTFLKNNPVQITIDRSFLNNFSESKVTFSCLTASAEQMFVIGTITTKHCVHQFMFRNGNTDIEKDVVKLIPISNLSCMLGDSLINTNRGKTLTSTAYFGFLYWKTNFNSSKIEFQKKIREILIRKCLCDLTLASQ